MMCINRRTADDGRDPVDAVEPSRMTRLADHRGFIDLESNPRWRYVLSYLAEARSTVVSLEEMATVLSTWEIDIGGHPTSDHREQVEIMLHHHYLPKLDALGILAYHPEDRTIRISQKIANLSWPSADTESFDEQG